MQEAEQLTKKTKRTHATRIPAYVENMLDEIVTSEKRSMANAISMILEEYVPIRKIMKENKYFLMDFETNDASKLQFSTPLAGVLAISHSIVFDKPYEIVLDPLTAKKLAANLLVFIASSSVNE